jgi:tetratricopeptide (TPR) repeat protein
MKKNLLLSIFVCLSFSIASAKEVDTLTTSSGIKYYITQKGSGPLLVKNWIAVVHYQLSLANGKKLDASRDRKTPFAVEYPSQFVIPGFNEALSLMHVGDKGTFIIPSALGYGDAGAGNVIPPKATLVYNIEVIDNKEQSLQTILDSALFTKADTGFTTPHLDVMMNTYKALKKQKFKGLYVSADDLNGPAYKLMKNYPLEAIKLFKLNTKLYPDSWNAYDSLGDGYKALGDDRQALENYEASLKLYPENSNALEMIKKIKASTF